MELLYIWINESKNKFIQKKEFNFSPQHKFLCELDGQRVVLRYEKVKAIDKGFLYKSNILNITAIVGENGSGKTSLLQYIYDSQCYPKTSNSDEAYRQMDEDEYEERKSILVYKENEDIVIYHNIDEIFFENKTGFKTKCLSNKNHKKKIKYIKELESSTMVYLTNSLYTYDHNSYSTHGLLNKICLTPNSVNVLSKKFYDKVVQYPELKIIKTPYNILQKILIKNKNSIDFQQICDVLYFHHIINYRLLDTYIGKINKEIDVNFTQTIDLIEKEYPGISFQHNNDTDDKTSEELKKTIDNYFNWLRRNVKKDLVKENICGKLYLNLIFELMHCLRKHEINTYKIDKIDEIEQFPAIIKMFLNEYTSIDENDKQAIDYYKHALREVNDIYSIIFDCKVKQTNVPLSDCAYNKSKVLSLNEDLERYTKFCDIVNSMAHANQSFVLKYIIIRNLHMSSGERAFQNIFSWLNLLPFFNQIIEKENVSLQKNILLLIDEVDLYAHPEWQRKYIKVLLDELYKQFKNNNVQIIFTTHSPFVLSDVLKENTIYLRKATDKCIVDDSIKHKQTFGSNIHALLNDAFYMSSTMGEFSKNKIEQVYEELTEYLKSNLYGKTIIREKSQDYKLFIESIGEPLIKSKLYALYNKCFPTNNDDLIVFYQSQIEILKRQLLESSEIDKNKVEEAINKLRETLEIFKSI